MENAGITWLVTFGMIGFWVLVAVVDLVRTPKTSRTNARVAARPSYQ